ncbi:MAG TPA: monofunctional biosynthetic peptidoglycan transglycosylase [Pseudobdellovibrionaceae bacterium]|nr:monofunctional biosynthetic peptidoglycan transglycosylase [Pseudobdellovibrionaceae bacterium]
MASLEAEIQNSNPRQKPEPGAPGALIQNDSARVKVGWMRRFLQQLARGLALILGQVMQWILATAVTSVVGVAIAGWVPITWTPLMGLRSFESLVAGQSPWARQVWRDDLSKHKHLVRALLAAEDEKFFEHHGFDFEAIAQAWEYNQSQRQSKRLKSSGRSESRRGIRGGSTITQQTAKNVFLWPQRSWVRKALEAWLTVWIEVLWPKSRILDVYLNVVEFGPNVYGAEAASRIYFGKTAARLSRAEAARLVAVLPNPRRLRVDQPNSYVLRRQAAILRRMSRMDVSAHVSAHHVSN